MRSQRVYLGTELKFKVDISASGFSMDTDSWSVTISCGKHSREFSKSDCISGDDGWFVCFDTTEFGPGMYYAKVTAYVPDIDFNDGIRTEIKKMPLLNVEAV